MEELKEWNYKVGIKLNIELRKNTSRSFSRIVHWFIVLTCVSIFECDRENICEETNDK